MKKWIYIVATAAIVFAGAAVARTIDVWGQIFEIEGAHPMMVEVGVMTDVRSKHHHMNYIKLKNGHMMAVVPMDQFMAFGKATGADDMLH